MCLEKLVMFLEVMLVELVGQWLNDLLEQLRVGFQVRLFLYSQEIIVQAEDEILQLNNLAVRVLCGALELHEVINESC